jgi:hypothetical protein
MPNVVRLHGKRSHAPALEARMATDLDAPQTACRTVAAHDVAKDRLRTTLSLLEMTFLNMRHLSTMIADPKARTVVEGELATLEGALSNARERAHQL